MLLKRLQIENENENDQGYRDRAYRGTTRETDSEDIISATNERGRSPAQVPFLFVSKLHDLLQDCDDDPDGKGTIVSWLCHGKAFRVHKRNDFVETILPVYFKQTKYKSFQRQLNLWGFDRIVQPGSEKGAYFHEHFLRGQPLIIDQMRRIRAIKKIPARERRRREALCKLQKQQECDIHGPKSKNDGVLVSMKVCAGDEDDKISNVSSEENVSLAFMDQAPVVVLTAMSSGPRVTSSCTIVTTCSNSGASSDEQRVKNDDKDRVIDKTFPDKMLADIYMGGKFGYTPSEMGMMVDEDDVVSLVTSSSSLSLLDDFMPLFSLDEEA